MRSKVELQRTPREEHPDPNCGSDLERLPVEMGERENQLAG
jgi:hypothetical protein